MVSGYDQVAGLASALLTGAFFQPPGDPAKALAPTVEVVPPVPAVGAAPGQGPVAPPPAHQAG